eukprot:403349022
MLTVMFQFSVNQYTLLMSTFLHQFKDLSNINNNNHQHSINQSSNQLNGLGMLSGLLTIGSTGLSILYPLISQNGLNFSLQWESLKFLLGVDTQLEVLIHPQPLSPDNEEQKLLNESQQQYWVISPFMQIMSLLLCLVTLIHFSNKMLNYVNNSQQNPVLINETRIPQKSNLDFIINLFNFLVTSMMLIINGHLLMSMLKAKIELGIQENVNVQVALIFIKLLMIGYLNASVLDNLLTHLDLMKLLIIQQITVSLFNFSVNSPQILNIYEYFNDSKAVNAELISILVNLFGVSLLLLSRMKPATVNKELIMEVNSFKNSEIQQRRINQGIQMTTLNSNERRQQENSITNNDQQNSRQNRRNFQSGGIFGRLGRNSRSAGSRRQNQYMNVNSQLQFDYDVDDNSQSDSDDDHIYGSSQRINNNIAVADNESGQITQRIADREEKRKISKYDEIFLD